MLAVHSDAPLIKRCRQEALSLAAAMIERSLAAARDSLDEAAHNARSVAASQSAQDALDRLEHCRAALRSAFPAALDQAIAEALDTAANPPAERQHDSRDLPTETELALLDDSELSHFVESSRLVQVVQPVVEHALARFDSLMSSALAQPGVRPDLNPMRPQVLCGALMRVLDEQSDSTEVRRLWLLHFAKPYARELDGLYGAMGDLLEREGVPQANYRIRFTESAAGQVVVAGAAVPVMSAPLVYPPGAPVMLGGYPAAFPGAPDQAADTLLEDDLSDEEAIRRRRAPMPQVSELAGAAVLAPQAVMQAFLYNSQLAPQYEVPLPPDYYAAVQQQLAQLSAEMAAASAPFHDEAAWLRSPQAALAPMSQLPQPWSQQAASPLARQRIVIELKAQAARVSQALGIDAARVLVAQIAADECILAPVRQVLVELEPALLRLALAEPRFFGDEAHPALCFIEEIIQRSDNYNDSDQCAPEFEIFVELVRQTVQALDAIAKPAGDNFTRSLKALQAQWQEQDEGEQQARTRSQGAMEFAQRRQQLADKIARDLSLRSDLAGVPSVVADFLLKDWSLVIAHAQLTRGRRQLDPGGYLSIVTDLLWSVKRSEILRDLHRLFEVVPRVIATLRQGLEMLGKNPHESQALFDTLLRFHEPALKLRRIRNALNQGATLEKMTAALQLLPEDKDVIKPGQPPVVQAAEQPWLGLHEREATGFMDDAAFDDTDRISLTGLAALEGETGIASMPQHLSGNTERIDELPTQPMPAQFSGVRPQGKAAAGQEERDIEAAARAKAQLTRLQRGDRVDLRSQQRWQRAELTWISDNSSLYTFISRGGRMHSMTRHTLEKLLRSGHVRPWEGSAVLHKASKAITASAMLGV